MTHSAFYVVALLGIKHLFTIIGLRDPNET